MDWQEARAGDGRLYWFNTISKESVWEKPDSLKTAAEKAIDQTSWKAYTAAGGRQYYVHSGTQETTWEIPAEVAKILAAPPPAPMPTPVTPNLSTSQTTTMAAGAGQLMSYTGAQSFIPTAATTSNEPVLWFNNDAEAVKAFTDMLKQNGVNASWTWERVLKECITEPMFKALRTGADRRAAFEKYLNDLSKRDVDRRQANLDRLRPAWREGLGSASEQGMKSWWSWNKAKELLQREEEEMWAMARDDNERRELWQEYVGEIQSKEAKRAADKLKMNQDKLAKLFDKFEISLETNWSQTRRMIERSKDWQNDFDLQQIDMSDFLQFYQNHIRVFEKEIEDIRLKQRDEKRHRIRKNRAGFVELLQELKDQGHIKTTTDWATIYPLIKSDERYQNILGNPGSSPLELFWDIVDELDQKVEENTRIVEVAIAESKKQVKLETTSEEFFEMLANPGVAKRIESISEEDRMHVFNLMHTRHVRLANEEAQRHERKRRQAIDDLRYAIRKIDPEIAVDCTFEDALPLISKLPEFQALKEEEDRRMGFDRYIQRMRERLEARKEEAVRQEAEELARTNREAEAELRDKERRERRRRRAEETGSEASPRRPIRADSKPRSVSRVADDVEMKDAKRSKRSLSPDGDRSRRHHSRDEKDESREERRRDRKRHRDHESEHSRERRRSQRSKHDDERSHRRGNDRDKESSRHNSAAVDSPRVKDTERMDIDEPIKPERRVKREDGELEEGEVA